ncbi:DNA (cytosine-5-)-methyltransferase [Anaerococcus sp. Marseille-P3915]|uniref:DNA (cytosine-5-)-methyltransferase n=1 Tax=Anaerococcus sp. Marseille-P3915 TaxID=2057799 RepID=UPI000D0BCE5D|nr:DNA (cytosine-5-)-methyltransferase [Anaerococcus sp. Marseille-P3915]
MKLSVVELFAGVGGFRVGLNDIKSFDYETGLAIENRDWDFVWANQFEPAYKTQDAYECYAKRFGKEDVSNLDINLVNKKTIPDHNLLVGGFPCQDYSVARSLSNEQGIEGKKGVLFWQIRDTLIEKNTPFVLLENVDRLLKSPASMRGRDFAIMLKTLDDLGYNVIWRMINAGEYSMPQKRRRVFIFAFKNDTKFSKQLIDKELNEILKDNFINRLFPINMEEKNNKLIRLKEYKDIADVSDNYKDGKFFETGVMINQEVFTSELEPISEEIYPLSKVLMEANYYNLADLSAYVVEDEKLDKWKYLKGSKRIERTNKNGHKYFYSEGSMSFPEDINSPARTMLTSEGTLNRSSHIIYDENIKKYRILTEIEAELIQMFPPNWTNTMPKRKRYFMMGNALVTGIINRMEADLREIILSEN